MIAPLIRSEMKKKSNVGDAEMSKPSSKITPKRINYFSRNLMESGNEFTVIGHGEIGGKASGLARIWEAVESRISKQRFPGIEVEIPRLTVIATDHFDSFMRMNDLYETAYSVKEDERTAYHFLKTELPAELVGDLLTIARVKRSPLAVRSSSLLEDAKFEPFAGIYGTKMLPGNQPSADTRFLRLVEAIKFIYASTFFNAAKGYFQGTGNEIENEKMAVIIQDVVGKQRGDRFYPDISGVARSYNFYRSGKARPEDGVVDLALGLGKTIVDGDIVWSYSPAFPRSGPPFSSTRDMLQMTQKKFWAINMGKPPAYDPMKETEYLVQLGLRDADYDGTLDHIAGTYDPQSDRIMPGKGRPGAKVVNFSPVLEHEQIPLNKLIKELLPICEDVMDAEVEVEFALSFDRKLKTPVKFGFLQVRPMVVSHENVVITEQEMTGADVLTASDQVMGNGIISSIKDIVFVKPETFEAKDTPRMALEIENINRKLVQSGSPYLLIGFGRWGSSDPWLGIPANWGQICGAKAIIEASFSKMRVELSQGSHFFHNLSCFQTVYFSINLHNGRMIDWDWLNNLKISENLRFVKHVKTESALTIKVDGKTGKGVILK